MEKTHFDVFVSYSRASDRDLADELAKFLESFHEQAQLEDDAGSLRELRVCVDRWDMRPGLEKPDGGRAVVLDEVIEGHLRASDMLLVLCSESSAKSEWVAKEIRWWIENKGEAPAESAETVRFAVTEGVGAPSRGNPLFPPAVAQFGLDRLMHYDFRGFREASADWRNVPDLEMELVRLAAEILGVSPGTLRPLWKRAQAQKEAGFARAIVDTSPRRALLAAMRSLKFEDSEAGRQALSEAYLVLVSRDENRRMMQERTGPGAMHFTGSWNQGQLVSVVSPTGQHIAIPSERGPDGPRPPGEVLLFDNYSLRSIAIPGYEAKRRLECIAFDTEGKHLFVVRQFYWSVYDMTGRQLHRGSFTSTKAPVPLVAGYLGGRYLVAADTSGGVWLLDPATDDKHQLHGEGAGDLALSCQVAGDQSVALLRYESGRVELVRPPKADGPEVLVLADEASSAAFVEGAWDEVVTLGADGVARWRLDSPSPTLLLAVPCDPDATEDIWVGAESLDVGMIDAEYVVTVADSSGDVVQRVDLKHEIDWTIAKGMPDDFIPVDRFDYRFGDRRFLRCSEGAFSVLQEEGGGERFVRLTGRAPAVRGFSSAGGRVWILTGAAHEGGAAFWIQDEHIAIPVPAGLGAVNVIADHQGRAWLGTQTGLWSWDGERYEQVVDVDTTVSKLLSTSDELWAYKDTYAHSPAWRIQEGRALPFPDGDSKVKEVHHVGGEIWLMEDNRLSIVRENKAEVLPVSVSLTSRLQVVNDAPWLCDQGAVQSWDGSDWTFQPMEGASDTTVYDLAGKTWLTCNLPDGESAVCRMDATRPLVLRVGRGRIRQLSLQRGQVWVASDAGPFRIEGDELLPCSDRRMVTRGFSDDGEDIWALGPRCVWRLRKGDATRFRTGECRPWLVKKLGELTWICTHVGFFRSGPAFYVEDGKVKRYTRWKSGEVPSVVGVQEVDGATFLTVSEHQTNRPERAFSS